MIFRIDLKIFLFLILYYFTNQIQTYTVIIFFAFLHEIGHLLAGLLLGMKPKKIEVSFCGFSISFGLIPSDYNRKIKNGNFLELKKIIIAMSGPLVNFFIIFISMFINVNVFSKLIIIYSNILLIGFNLIPIYPLDGGRVLRGVLYIFCGKNNAEKYTNLISFIVLIILTFGASIIILYYNNISIFIIIIFLWGLYIKEDLIYRRKNKIYNLIKKTIEID